MLSRARMGGRPRRSPRLAVLAVALVAVVGVLAPAASADPIGHAPPLAPIDPQNWEDPSDQTWDDYQAIPNTDWGDPALQPSIRKWKVALVAVDFPDVAFSITEPVGTNIFGNPIGVGSVPREDAATWWRDFLNTPQALNHEQTMNKYWMEDSLGRYGVQLDAFGPYLLSRKQYEYTLVESITGVNSSWCPTQTTAVGAQAATPTIAVVSSSSFSVGQVVSVAGNSGTRTISAIDPDGLHLTFTTNVTVSNNAFIHSCNGNIRTDSLAAWRAAEGQTINSQYDNIFYLTAGQDESGTWQEFGEMLFGTQDDVPDAWGNPNDLLPNWAPTRFVPWTSFRSAATIWPNASGNTSVEGEASGMGTFAHELTHNLGLSDNYNNPYGVPAQRPATGYWDMMSRGSFNGPGGTHTRWNIPPVQGSSLGSTHNVRNKVALGFTSEAELLRLRRNGLANSGIVIAELTAREVQPATGGLSGINILLDGSAPVDKAPACVNTVANPDPTCATPNFQNFTMEVVQRIGNDSFQTASGVLISKTRTSSSTNCGTFSCFVWIVDAHPEDINLVDYYRADGTPSMIAMSHGRQLNDATFNAGLNSGTEFEWVDPNNRLHFYVIDLRFDEDGIRHYTVAVRSLDGAGPHGRGVSVGAGTPVGHTPAWAANCNFPVTNSGTVADTDPAIHLEDARAYLGGDVFRLSASTTDKGWTAQLANALVTASAGATVTVPVYVTRVPTSTGKATVQLTATSESDPSKTSTATCTLKVADTTPAAQ